MQQTGINGIRTVLTVLVLWGASTTSQALVLDHQCSTGDAVANISTANVTGTNGVVTGNATDCFGAYGGNDPSSSEPLSFNGIDYEFISKAEMNDSGGMSGFDGLDIGWAVSGDQSGTWSFDATALDDIGDFLIVLKAANDPGWAAYAFWGDPANTFYEGTYQVVWEHNGKNVPALSHISLYAAPPSVSVPEPGLIMLLGTGLLLIGLRRQ